jgi:ABC-type branched-subunit amino acid transport system substrate-binding protein
MKVRYGFAMQCVALAGAAGLGLAACSSSSSTSSSTSSASATAGSPSASAGASSASPAPISTASAQPPAKVTGTISGPGVTASTITIGQITTTSGANPGLFQGANDGLDAYVAYLNANGGIDGKTVKVIHVDDAQDCNTFTQEMQRLSTQVYGLVGNFSLVDSCGQSVLKANPQLLDVGYALDPLLLALPNVYSPTPTPPGTATTGLEWLKKQFPNDVAHTAALIPAATLPVAQETMLTAQSIGYKYVYQRVTSNTETNFTSDILRMKSLGVKIVDMTAASLPLETDFLQQANQQNFTFDAILPGGSYDSRFVPMLANQSLANGKVYQFLPTINYLGSQASSVPGYQNFVTWLKKAHPTDQPNTFSISAWGSGMLFTQAMAAAGKQVTPATTLKALAGITSFDSGGITAPYNPGKKLGSPCVAVVTLKGGQWTQADPASSGFDCSGTYHNLL